MPSPTDNAVARDDWSRLSAIRELPEIDLDALYQYRLGRIRQVMRECGLSLAVLLNPLSLLYASGFREFTLLQSRIPVYYLFVPLEGPLVMHSGYKNPGDDSLPIQEYRPPHPINVFTAGPELAEHTRQFAVAVRDFLRETDAHNTRIAVDQVNPGVTQALMQVGMEVHDAVALMESAKAIKSSHEIQCMRWSIAVAEHAMAKMHEVLEPGITENQLWGLLNYANLANDGQWHDTRMLASGPRTNPWVQEASERQVQSGDLVAFDTDMIGPFGYCADLSRTFHCGPARPNDAQRELYQRAFEEIQHNLQLLRPGISLREFADQDFRQPDGFDRYPCIAHAVGMSDEYPRIPWLDEWASRGTHAVIEPGMVMCIESYVGKTGGHEGVKLEDQVLVTEDGIENLTSFPFERSLLS